ncbi:MAG TPA: hypothetical protein PKN92_02625 [Candidatus Hydrogenedentes bacterium]|nr:hypothetical protein [Candidatus Hydrogenedentota bacterium]HPX86026.1 hypothetical protein [Candidatus Hydrogenedentota bacterium]
MQQRRLLVLDALRGFFILFVICIHAVSGVIYGNNAQALENVPLWQIILFAPLLLISTWAPIFVVISGMAQAYVLSGLILSKKAANALSLRNFFGGVLVTSLFLYLLSLVNMAFFHHPMDYAGEFRYTFLTGALHAGHWVPFDMRLLFYNDALSMISINGLLVTCILYFLWKINWIPRTRKASLLLLGVAASFFALSPLLHQKLDPIFLTAVENGHAGTAFFLRFFVGIGFSTFPYAAYGLTGAILGLFLAKRKEEIWLRRDGYRAATAMVLSSVVLMGITGFAPKDVIHHPYPFKMQLLVLGTILLTCIWLILKLEYFTEEQRAYRAKKTVWLRRFGLLALTIFCFESVLSMLFSKAYCFLWGFDEAFPKTAPHILFFLALNVLFWTFVLKFWEKINFKYSIEWWISCLAGIVRGRPSARLQADAVLYKPCLLPEPVASPCPAGLENR